MKLCFHVELAYWFYLDLQRPEDSSLPACSMKEFMATSILEVQYHNVGLHCMCVCMSLCVYVTVGCVLMHMCCLTYWFLDLAPFPVFRHYPFLVRELDDNHLDSLIAQWKSHKYRRPIRGAIILNKNLTKVWDIQGWP